MDKIFMDAKDKNVAKVVVYLDDGIVYFDEDCTEEVPEEAMFDLFVKGVVAFDGTNYKAAKGYNEDDGIIFASIDS